MKKIESKLIFNYFFKRKFLRGGGQKYTKKEKHDFKEKLKIKDKKHLAKEKNKIVYY